MEGWFLPEQFFVLNKTTICYCTPPLLTFLGSNHLVKRENLTSVRVIFYGTAPLGLSDIEKLLNKLPNPENVTFRNAYGLTETSPILITPMAGNTKLTSAGVPLPNTQVRIVSSSGENLGPREDGEIYVKGPQVMKGYYKNDKSTAEAFENGWLKTGDIGFYDEKGRFYIVGRLKEMIKVDGYQVAPAELEAILRSHPHVADVGVIGVPDERTKEKPIAFVQPQPGVTIEIYEISDFLGQHIAPYKRLREIIITDNIPRNPTGKILRNNLREQYLSIKSSSRRSSEDFSKAKIWDCQAPFYEECRSK